MKCCCSYMLENILTRNRGDFKSGEKWLRGEMGNDFNCGTVLTETGSLLAAGRGDQIMLYSNTLLDLGKVFQDPESGWISTNTETETLEVPEGGRPHISSGNLAWFKSSCLHLPVALETKMVTNVALSCGDMSPRLEQSSSGRQRSCVVSAWTAPSFFSVSRLNLVSSLVC